MKPIEGLKSASAKLDIMPEHPIYAPASEGPFACKFCEYYSDPNKCNQPIIVKLRKGIVEPDACCDWFEKDR